MAAFKSGVVLMALKGGCPIVPMYIRKRKNIFRRQVTVYGEPVTVSLSETKLPVMEYINKVAADLREKEIELEIKEINALKLGLKNGSQHKRILREIRK